MMAPEIHNKPADRHRKGCVGAHGDEEECAILGSAVREDIEKDGKARYGDADGNNGKEKAVSYSVGKVGDKHCRCKGTGPRRDAMKLSLDRGVAVASYNCWLRRSLAINPMIAHLIYLYTKM